MTDDKLPDWFMVNQLVAKEHQYLDAPSPPLDSIRMAWPFKTEAERELIRKWFKKQDKARRIENLKIIEQNGEALL